MGTPGCAGAPASAFFISCLVWRRYACGLWGLVSLGTLPNDVRRSLASKSVTAQSATGVAQRIGGVPALPAVFAVSSGLIGTLSERYLLQALGIRPTRVSWMARGFTLDATSHGLGDARALQINVDAGAHAALALRLQVLLASILLPIIAH